MSENKKDLFDKEMVYDETEEMTADALEEMVEDTETQNPDSELKVRETNVNGLDALLFETPVDTLEENIEEPSVDSTENSKLPSYICTLCGYIYDPAEGDPDNGVEACTAFEDIPEDWVCPVCGAEKDMFEIHE